MNENEVAAYFEEKNTEAQPEKVWSAREKILLGLSLLIAVAFDRLIISNFFTLSYGDARSFQMFSAIFWLSYLAVFYGFFWKKLKSDYIAWCVCAATAALCVWNIILPHGNYEFASITFLVIPGVLMAHAQWCGGAYTLKNSEGMALAWLSGWFVKPFSGFPALAGATYSLFSNKSRPVAYKVLLGLVLSLAIMSFILPLLMGADQVFNYYISQMFSNISLFSIVFHGLIVILAFALFYSFLWNVGFGENKPLVISQNLSIDIIISSIALGSVLFIYTAFCLIQFTYLFAGAGLPADMTYSEYAREGFSQTVAVCAINLLLFAVFLRLGKGQKLLNALLLALLALTFVMLVSGAVRLNLYISAYGMTWLRLLSAWFIIYLATVNLICNLRLLFKKDLPVLAISALLLLIWYVALGYLNPDEFIYWYNMRMMFA